ncbi:hypothetical protein BDN72DRAFT_577215 [Pluteus cervinus]|uniref:Uncharacterized protein n=1 Tax=Pluteus cervinus TaxID=181527 RepID=A0ACD3AVE2_9AGAR|nr:hypothetical protein BDN72DRAFT_577215 [Pluteus cervinus]
MFTGMYRYLITDYLNPSLSLDTNTGSGDFYVHIGGALSVVIVVLVQLYYAWRLWAFSINTSNALRCLLTVATVVLSLLTFTAGILIVARTFPKFQSEPSIFDTNGFSGLSWGLQLCSSIACDTVITFGMMLNLRRTRAGFRSTLCIVCLVCFYALQPQSNLAYAGLQILMPRCYIISFLATLNSREYLREKLVAGALSFGGSNPGSNQAGCRTHAANTSSAESENLANELVNVKIMYTTEKMVERDGSVEQDRIGRAVV